MTDESLRDRKRLDRDVAEADTPIVTAIPGQLFTGYQVGFSDLREVCIDCAELLREGDPLVSYASQPAETTPWEVQRCYCAGCAPDDITVPTLGTSELLMKARLGTVALPRQRTHRLCLVEVEYIAFSPPVEGSEP